MYLDFALSQKIVVWGDNKKKCIAENFLLNCFNLKKNTSQG